MFCIYGVRYILWHNSTFKSVNYYIIHDPTSQPQNKPLETPFPIQNFIYTKKKMKK